MRAVHTRLLAIVLAMILILFSFFVYQSISYGWYTRNDTAYASGLSVRMRAAESSSGLHLSFLPIVSGDDQSVLQPGRMLIYTVDGFNSGTNAFVLQNVTASCGQISYPTETIVDYYGNELKSTVLGNYFYYDESGERYIPEESEATAFFENNFRYPAFYALKYSVIALPGIYTSEDVEERANGIDWSDENFLFVPEQGQDYTNFYEGDQVSFEINRDISESIESTADTVSLLFVLYFEPEFYMSTTVDGMTYTLKNSNSFMAQTVFLDVAFLKTSNS